MESEQDFRLRHSSEDSEIKAFLGAGTEFQGTLTFDGTIRVDGKLSGEVISKDTLIVGEGAEVEAEINVGNLVSWGSIRGNVKASERIQLHESSNLNGNISAPRLTIAEGAFFNGSCEMPQAGGKVTPITPSAWRSPVAADESSSLLDGSDEAEEEEAAESNQ